METRICKLLNTRHCHASFGQPFRIRASSPGVSFFLKFLTHFYSIGMCGDDIYNNASSCIYLLYLNFPFSAQFPFRTVAILYLQTTKTKLESSNFISFVQLHNQNGARERTLLLLCSIFCMRETPANRFPYIYFVPIP